MLRLFTDLSFALLRANIAAAISLWCPPPRKPEPPAKPAPRAMTEPIFRGEDWDLPRREGEVIEMFRKSKGDM